VLKAANTDKAVFWSGDPNGTEKPPGQLLEAVIDISEGLTPQLSLSEDARLFALVSTAFADSVIAQWQAKYFYDHWRPVTGVNDPSNPKMRANSGGQPVMR